MIYLLIFLVLLLIMLIYIKIAHRYEFFDLPNNRSSHTIPTVVGGGIIFPIMVLIWSLTFDHSEWFFVTSVILISIVGYIDDVLSLSPLTRLIIQFISAILLLIEFNFMSYSIVLVTFTMVLIVGWLNTFNFLDGINGISVLYSSSILVGILLFNDYTHFIPLNLIYLTGISLLVFGFFNLRIKAKMFMGDVGSLSLGLILSYFLLKLILNTGRWDFILFFSVYGIDSILTIVDRISMRQNIFNAHRNHLYQNLTNDLDLPHLFVSFLYFFIQLMIILGLYYISDKHIYTYFVIVLISLTSIYIYVKRYIYTLST